jgi:hypothetical protein
VSGASDADQSTGHVHFGSLASILIAELGRASAQVGNELQGGHLGLVAESVPQHDLAYVLVIAHFPCSARGSLVVVAKRRSEKLQEISERHWKNHIHKEIHFFISLYYSISIVVAQQKLNHVHTVSIGLNDDLFGLEVRVLRYWVAKVDWSFVAEKRRESTQVQCWSRIAAHLKSRS